MAGSCEKLDQMVKDYLLFRGFSATSKALDQELKSDKDKGLRVDRMMEQIWALIVGYDLQGLREYWRYLNHRLFSRLEQRYAASERKLESSLLKLYLVNAYQSGRQDKVLAFFEQTGAELQSHPDFKEWFAFPFVANPSENPLFSLYFNKQWQDTLLLSLHNFLSVILQAMPVPTLLNVEFDARRMKNLQEENTSLKQQLLNASSSREASQEVKTTSRKLLQSEVRPPSSPPDMVFDFSGLANELEPPDQEKQKSTRRFPLSLTSPLTNRKKTADSALMKAKASGSSSNLLAGNTGTSGKLKASESTMATSSGQSRVAGDVRRQTVAAVSTSSVSFAQSTTVTSKQSLASKPGPVARQSPNQLTKHSSFPATNDIITTNAYGTNRSFSVPEEKAAGSSGRDRPAVHELLLNPQPPPLPVSVSQTITAGSASPGSDNSVSLISDADSPFLLLEDEYLEHRSTASYSCFSQTGQYIASLDVDGIVKVWVWSPQPATTATVMSRSAFLSLAWASKSDRWLLLGNKAGTIRLFDVKGSKTFREVLVSPDNPANCMRVTDISTSPSNMQFVCATSDLCPFSSDLSAVSGKLLLWDLRILKLEKELVVDSAVCNAITCSSYSSTGSHLLTGGADGTIRIYDLHQDKAVMKWPGHDLPIHTVQFQGDNSVYSMSADGKLHEWNLCRPGQPVNSLSVGPRDVGQVHAGSCRGRLFSLDLDRHYLLTYQGRKGAIYKVSGVPSPQCVMELRSHKSPVVTVDWSPSHDTRVCLTSSADSKVKISTLLPK